MNDFVEVEVCNVEIERRTVSIPKTCECGADLTKEAALLVWEYQDHQRHATVGDNELGWPDLPEGGEAYIQLRFSCAQCDKVLARGREEERYECYECGQPAFFHVFCYGNNEKTPETLMCGAHAAEHAADGSLLIRTPEHAEHMGYEPKEPTSG